MQPFYVLASLLASGLAIAGPAAEISGHGVNGTSKASPTSSSPPHAQTTLADKTVIDLAPHSCWSDPAASVDRTFNTFNTSSYYASGICHVCVSQSLSQPHGSPPLDYTVNYIFVLSDLRVHIRDHANRDMLGINSTLWSYPAPGFRQWSDFLISMLVGEKELDLWINPDSQHIESAVVYLDFGLILNDTQQFGNKAPMMFNPSPGANSSDNANCTQSAISPDKKRVYFECRFAC